MDRVSQEMIEILMIHCKSVALDIISNEGYYNINDWDEMSEAEKYNEAKNHLK